MFIPEKIWLQKRKSGGFEEISLTIFCGFYQYFHNRIRNLVSRLLR